MDESVTGVGKQPLGILFAGFAAVIIVFVLGRVFAPEGINAWVPYLFIWVASVVAYILPFTLFYLANGRVERMHAALKHDRKLVNFVRFSLVALGILASTINSLYLATEISKTLNGLG